MTELASNGSKTKGIQFDFEIAGTPNWPSLA